MMERIRDYYYWSYYVHPTTVTWGTPTFTADLAAMETTPATHVRDGSRPTVVGTTKTAKMRIRTTTAVVLPMVLVLLMFLMYH